MQSNVSAAVDTRDHHAALFNVFGLKEQAFGLVMRPNVSTGGCSQRIDDSPHLQ